MSELNATVKNKQNKSRKSQDERKSVLEFSKKLAYIDVISWMIICIVLLILLFKEPMLGTYIQNLFAYATTAYVSLRLGYTAKAGVENYQKIHNAYKEITIDGDTDDMNG